PPRCTAFRLTNSLFPISFANWEARLISSFFAAWIRPPSVPENITAITQRVLELSAGEARSVRWRSGFYEVQDSSSKVVSKILGEPNIATELHGTEPNKQ